MTTQEAAQGVDEKLQRWEPHIRAFVELCETRSGTVANGPLSGLKVGIKDVIDVTGLPTRNGSETCRDAESAVRDAPVVAALRAAGADIIGKTTTTEFAFTDPTDCRNPFDLNRTPGGSSSGSGAAVAAGIVDIALGTQTAGSLCRPAAYCGVVGFKPSHEVLSTVGVTPLAPSFDTVGIIAQSVTLARRAFNVMNSRETLAKQKKAKTVVCGLWKTDISASPDAMDAFHEASQAISLIGCNTRSSQLVADVDRIVAAHRCVMNFEAHAAHGAMLSDARGDSLKPKFRAGLCAGAAVSEEQCEEAAVFLSQEKRDFWRRLADVDVVLTLPVPDAPPLIDGTTGFQDWLTPWTVFGGPLVCLPWGCDRSGLPRSVMLAAHPHNDMQLLDFAATLETESPLRPKPHLPKT